jgi:hypothetical protein
MVSGGAANKDTDLQVRIDLVLRNEFVGAEFIEGFELLADRLSGHRIE